MLRDEPKYLAPFDVRRIVGAKPLGGTWRAWCNRCSWTSGPSLSHHLAHLAGEHHQKVHRGS